MNEEDKQFSNDRLKKALCGLKEKNVTEILKGIRTEVKNFTGDVP